MRWIYYALIVALTSILVLMPSSSNAAEPHVVYSVLKGLYMGDPKEPAKKDIFITMGTKHGLKNGAIVKAYRKTPSYDLIAKQLHKDVTFPIADLRIIHVEEDTAIARIQKMLPLDNTPTITPRTVMVGDVIRRR